MGPETGCVLPSNGQKWTLQLQLEYSEILFVEFQVATVMVGWELSDMHVFLQPLWMKVKEH